MAGFLHYIIGVIGVWLAERIASKLFDELWQRIEKRFVRWWKA